MRARACVCACVRVHVRGTDLDRVHALAARHGHDAHHAVAAPSHHVLQLQREVKRKPANPLQRINQKLSIGA